MDSALLQQIMGMAPMQDQQSQIDQQIADLVTRRRDRRSMPYKTPFGAGLGGIADIIAAYRSRTGEEDLRQQRADLDTKQAGARTAFAQAMMGAQAPVQHPPEGIRAPEYNPQAVEQDHAQDLQRLGMAGMLSGDPMIGKVASQLTDPRVALERQALEQGAKKFPLELAMEQQKLAAGGPQEALGGQTPSTFELLTKRAGVPKVMSVAPGNSVVDARTGKPLAGGVGGGAAGGLSPEALDQHARKYLQDQTLPQLGKGNLVGHMAIINRAAELGGDQSLAANRASTKADTGSLAGLTKQADAMNGFESTALKNLDQFLATAKTVVDPGSPLFNAPARKFMQYAAGDPKMAEFNATRQVAVQEISKVLGGSLGGAAVSDSARHEASGLISPDASLAQIEAAANILKKDMANRKASVEEQIKSVRGRIGGAPAASGAGADGTPKKKVYNPATGQIEER